MKHATTKLRELCKELGIDFYHEWETTCRLDDISFSIYVYLNPDIPDTTYTVEVYPSPGRYLNAEEYKAQSLEDMLNIIRVATVQHR